MAPQGRERRRLRRVLKRIPVQFETASVRASGHIKNLSKQGIFVRSNVLPMPGDRVSLVFEKRDGSKVEVAGIVRWTTAQIGDPEAAQPGFGVELSGETREFHSFFEEILLH